MKLMSTEVKNDCEGRETLTRLEEVFDSVIGPPVIGGWYFGGIWSRDPRLTLLLVRLCMEYMFAPLVVHGVI